jgi:hypothetical protein
MARALCDYAAMASVMVLALGTPADAQDAEPKGAAAAAPLEAAPAPSAAPAAAPETAPAPVATPAPEAAPAPQAAPAARSKHIIGGAPPPREQKEPDHIRGQITKVEASSIEVRTRDGRTVRLALPGNLAIFSLAKSSFGNVDFGTYVGAVSVRLGDDIYSPIRRDSLSWLHRGFELRIIDEQLRGIAVGYTRWDLAPESVITHGWVDDMEDRVLSIKYGPTDIEETDVEVPRDVPIVKMSRGERNLIKAGVRVFAGAHKDADGNYVTVFIFVGKDGVVPAM